MKTRQGSLSRRVLTGFIASAVVLAFAPAAHVVQDTAKVSTTIRGGLRAVTFDTIQGEVIVNLPDDMRAGDTISGTVVLEPKKKEREDRSMSFELLFDTFKTVKVPTSGGSKETFTFNIPAAANDKGTGQINLALKDEHGALIQTATVPIGPPRGYRIVTREEMDSIAPPRVTAENGKVAPPLRAILAAGNSGFTLPQIAQQGRPVEVHGPFDGSFENTKLNVGGQDTTILAESPRKVVFRIPVDSSGPTEITIKEGDKEGKGNFRNVGVKLSAPKTTLLRGERTTLTVQVTGLEGIKKPVPLTLEAKGVITMEGGTYQPLVIQPSQVGADGRYSTTRGITGVQAGGWEATATVETHRFNVCLQDDSTRETREMVLLWNTFTGDYIFMCLECATLKGQTTRGPYSERIERVDPATTGNVARKGCVFTLQHNVSDRRVMARVDMCTHAGSASVQTSQPNEPKIKFTITDRNMTDNVCACESECR